MEVINQMEPKLEKEDIRSLARDWYGFLGIQLDTLIQQREEAVKAKDKRDEFTQLNYMVGEVISSVEAPEVWLINQQPSNQFKKYFATWLFVKELSQSLTSKPTITKTKRSKI
jgi:hypothetical protein